MKLFWVIFFLPAIYSMVSSIEYTQQTGPPVVRTITGYAQSIAGKPGFNMKDIKACVPGIRFDLRYASINNFLHQKIYPAVSSTYAREKVTVALQAVQQELKEKGLGLLIFDAYRPYSATKKIWELVKDERYAANPAKGSNHNRGAAVDLTIIDLTTGARLDMGTNFDSFSDSAHHDFPSLPAHVIQNRLLLKSVMLAHGFEAFETEWWHYALPGAKEYVLLDLSFEQLKKITGH